MASPWITKNKTYRKRQGAGFVVRVPRITKYPAVSSTRYATPLIKFTRESHQPFKTTAVTTVSPMIDPQPFSGECSGSAASCSGDSRARKTICAASETSHDNIIPKKAARKMKTNASPGANVSSSRAATMPNAEASKARLGVPFALNRPKLRGAHPLRAIENSILDETYSAAFAPDNAAVKTTKFIRCAAPGIFTDRKTETNGLSVTAAELHGITPTSTAIEPRYKSVSTANVIRTAFAMSFGERDSPDATATNSTPPNV